MALREGSAELAGAPAGPAGPAAAPVRVTARGRGRGRGRFLVSALRLRRALKAEVGVLLSLLSPLGSGRLLGLKGVAASQQPVDAPSLQKKPLSHSLFQLMLVLCLLLCILCYFTSISSVWDRFAFRSQHQRVSNQTTGLGPKHRATPSETPTPAPAPPVVFQYHIAYPRNYLFIMDNKDLCMARNPFLVLMVAVRPNDVEARDAIRRTWGNETLVRGKAVLTLFMLGLSGGSEAEKVHGNVKEENLQHQDLIQSDFMESYANLTIKTMVMMHWLATRCPTAAYAMKVDSDMFLNIENLVIMLKRPDIPKTDYLTGYLMWDRPVVRSRDSKWYVSEELYPEPIYPTYALGMGYVFSNDLPLKYVEISKSVSYFNVEDAYIGKCMKMLGLEPKSPPDPSQFKAYLSHYDRCEFSKVITYILGSPKDLLTYWTDLKRSAPPC
ncbi:beta-1,3-galactosyltransferase 5-like [Brachionichthys hirsutus]|uniref:beta-1,3-galactosyltransferase 5-like n=1 Tax=Brachionichthys hirsutus TaxID=412623 RepID=UPI003604AAFD